MSQMSNNTTTSAAVSATQTIEFNDADVMFLQTMYPHHAQAVDMANMVDGRTTTPQIVDLAAAIEAAQGPEMEQMTTLLQQWGKPAPEGGMSGMNQSDSMSGMDRGDTMSGMDHGSGDMTGMMTDQQMSELAGKSGADFDTAWLAMMVEHHTGAIEMAQTELADGRNTDAKQRATEIIGAQQAEITTMNALLAQK
jgi:uncharacterized protein (DUF305 family)